MLIALTLIAVAFISLNIVTRRRVSPFYITFAQLGFALIGYVRLQESGHVVQSHVRAFEVGLLSLVAGFLYATLLHHASASCKATDDSSRGHASQPESASTLDPEAARRACRKVWFVFVLVAGLTVYHFSAIGLPILSPNVEIERWNFTSSGLFGLPGRSYLMGLPVVFILIELQRRKFPGYQPFSVLYWCVLASLAITRIVGGFKGELFELVVLVMIVRLTGPDSPSLSVMVRRYATAILATLVFAASVGSLYVTTVKKGTSGGQLISDRVTTGLAQAGEVLYTMMDGDPGVHPTILQDVDTYARSIAGLRAHHFLLIKEISASMHGIELGNPDSSSSDSFVVPTTPGAIPVLYYNAGIFGYLLIFGFGCAFAVVTRWASETKRPFGSIVAVTSLVFFDQIALKGDFATIPMNWLAMVCFVWALWSISESVIPAGHPDGIARSFRLANHGVRPQS